MRKVGVLSRGADLGGRVEEGFGERREHRDLAHSVEIMPNDEGVDAPRDGRVDDQFDVGLHCCWILRVTGTVVDVQHGPHQQAFQPSTSNAQLPSSKTSGSHKEEASELKGGA